MKPTPILSHCRLPALLCFLFVLTSSLAVAASFDVTHYGAKGDGTTLETPAIQRAIDAAARTRGTVVLPTGTYLSGSLFIRKGVTLHLNKGAVIQGSHSLADYPVMQTRVAGIEMKWPAALVNVYEQSDVTIEGEGTIDGDGKVWWDSYWSLRKGYEPRGLRWASDYDAQRPRLIQFYKSSHIKLAGLLLRRSGFWTVHICYSDDVTVDGITIRNNEGGRGPSTDGIDIDSSRHVLVQHADISVNDDALCLKAGRDADGLRVNKPTEEVVIRDSIIRSGAAGVTIGSETSGGFRNIEAYGLTVLAPVPVGILFKSSHTRGGFAENIRIHDLTMTGVPVVFRVTMNWNPSYSNATIPPSEKNYPDYWKVLATPVPAEQGIPHVHDVHIWNIKASGAATVFEVSAYPQVPLERFTLDHFDVDATTAGHIQDARDWKLSDMTIRTKDGSEVSVTDSVHVTGLGSNRQ